MPLWQETILLLGLALVLALIIKSLFVQAFYIPSPSMEPLFIKNDRILVQKVSYWGGSSPSRGDIVVFKDPGGWLNEADTTTPQGPITKIMEKVGLYPTGGHLVKRVIGVGGDRVVCCDAKGRITVNGKALNEKAYLPKGTAPSQIKFDRTIPKEHLWMMGDNRSFSYDSRGHMGGPGGGFVEGGPRRRQGVHADLAVEACRVHPPTGHVRGHPRREVIHPIDILVSAP